MLDGRVWSVCNVGPQVCSVEQTVGALPWSLGRSRSQQTIRCILESKSAALVAAVFVDFPKNKGNFCKKARYRTAGPISHRAAPYEEFFSWRSRHHCPVEIGAYVNYT